MKGKNYENKTFPNCNLPLHSGARYRRLRPARPRRRRCVRRHRKHMERGKNVVNHVVFPVIDMILAILFFVKVATCYFEYRKHGQLELAAPCILFACLIFTLTAPLYLWSIL